MRLVYLRWLFCYLNEPYEYGGKWFGGRTTDVWHDTAPPWDYHGYGIDCSGLVSCGARWAEYHWGTTPGGWRRTTRNLAQVSNLVNDLNDVVPGDIMLKPGHHVRTIYHKSGDTIHQIAAEGDPTSKVVTLLDMSLAYEHQHEGYNPMHLIAY